MSMAPVIVLECLQYLMGYVQLCPNVSSPNEKSLALLMQVPLFVVANALV